MIERVAEALDTWGWFQPRQETPAGFECLLANTPGQTTRMRNDLRKRARFALEAMREPTQDMLDAPGEALVSVGDYTMSAHEAREAWRAMIDEALR